MNVDQHTQAVLDALGNKPSFTPAQAHTVIIDDWIVRELWGYQNLRPKLEAATHAELCASYVDYLGGRLLARGDVDWTLEIGK